MKKLLFIISIVVCGLVYGQTETIFFPEDQPEILIGKTIKALPNKFEMYHFSELNKKSGMFLSGNKFNDYKKYVGKSFKVKDIITDNYKSKYLVLNEVGKQNDLYYKYNPKIPDDFKFSILDFQVPTDFYCNQIEKIGNNYYSPNKGVIRFMKIGKSTMLEVKKYGDEMLIGDYDVVLFLEDHTKLIFPHKKVDTRVVENHYEISSIVELSPDDVQKLIKTNITGYLIGNISNRYAIDDSRARTYLNCLIDK